MAEDTEVALLKRLGIRPETRVPWAACPPLSMDHVAAVGKLPLAPHLERAVRPTASYRALSDAGRWVTASEGCSGRANSMPGVR